MKNLLFVTLLLSLFLTGCKKATLKVEKVEVDENNVVIAPVTTKPRGSLDLSAIADSVRFVRLDNADEALIGSVSYVHFIDSLMFVHDGTGRAILVFDNAGHFKYKILRRGGGPGEYQSIMRLMVDDIKKQLIIYDISLRKMIFYNFQGETIKEINRFNDRKVLRDIINLPNGHFLCYRDDYEEDYDTRGLWETDSLGNRIRYLLKPTIVYPHNISRGVASHLYQLPDNKIGLMSSENEIYHYENDTLKKFITYKSDGISILNFPGQHKINEKYNLMYKTHEKNNYVLTQWHDENLKPYYSLYSSTDKTTTTFDAIHYDSAGAFIGQQVHSNLTNVLLLSCPGITVSKLLHDNTRSAHVINRIRALTSGMSDEEIEDMNPILEIVYLKENGEIPARYKQH